MVDMFLKLDSIEGDATAKGHEKEIHILTFSWGASQTASLSGTGSTAGKVVVQDFSFVKEPDSATPKLFEAVCVGKHIKEATLTLQKTGESQDDFMKIKMSDVLISSYQSGGSVGMMPGEQVSFSFQKLELSSAVQNPDGSTGSWVTHGCDFAAQTKI